MFSDLNRRLKKPLLILLTILVLLPIFLWISQKVIDPSLHPNKDFFTFWLGGRLITLGKNPYLHSDYLWGRAFYDADLIPDATFVYPLPFALLFAPLGLLPLNKAFVVWDTLTQVMILVSLLLLVRSYAKPLAKNFFPLLLIAVILFRPTYITLVNAQLSGFFFLLLSAIIYLWNQGKWKQGSLLLALFALKPTLGLPIMAVLTLFLLLRKQYSAIFTLAAALLALLLSGFLVDPHWVSHYWQIGNDKLGQTFGFSPTLWGAATLVCQFKSECSIISGGAGCLAASIAVLFFFINRRQTLAPVTAVCLAIIFTMLVTPYIWPYDQLLLVIPIVTVVMEKANRGDRFLPTAFLLILIDLFSYFLLFVSMKNEHEIWNFFIPLVILILTIPWLKKGYQPA